MRLFGVALVVAMCSAQAWAQGGIFADGFELGHACRWSQQLPAQDCSEAFLTVTLPGGVPLILVKIPAGVFWMGSPVDERGRYDIEDLHEVTLTQDYYIGKFEVTQAQWQAVMGTPMPLDCGSYGVGPNYPVYCVTWNDISGSGGFVERLNTYLGTTAFRLATDAEWERAARAGTQTRFSHGDVLECDDECGVCATHDQYMWWCGNVTISCQPVGSKLPNAFGLYDMHGNLYEWVQDWFQESLGASPVTDPTGPGTGSERVHRSGRWGWWAQFCRAASRGSATPDHRHSSIGFRLARTAP